MPDLEFEDKKMPMTEINKTHNSLRFIHAGEGNEVSVLLHLCRQPGPASHCPQTQLPSISKPTLGAYQIGTRWAWASSRKTAR